MQIKKCRFKQGKRTIFYLIMVLLLITVTGCGDQKAALPDADNERKTVTVQDSADRYVEVPYPIERIVVLWDNPTEVVQALGAIERIVGIDVATKDLVNQGLYPELQDIPVVGSWDEPNYEIIAGLEPDVVIMLSSYPPLPDEVQKQLEPFGIAVVGLDFYRTEVYFREVTTLGFMLGLEERAADYIAFYKETLDMIASRLGEIPDSERKLVYFEAAADYRTYGGGGYGAGIPDMVRAGGGIDLYPEITAVTFEVDPEDIGNRNPDVIFKGQPAGYFITDESDFKSIRDSIAARPELAGTKAVTNGDVYVISFDVTGGARKIFGPMFLAKILYPDRFTDLDPEAILREYLETYLGRSWQGLYVYPGY